MTVDQLTNKLANIVAPNALFIMQHNTDVFFNLAKLITLVSVFHVIRDVSSETVAEDIFDYIKDPKDPEKLVAVKRFTLTNAMQTTVQIITYGATVTTLKLMSKDGTLDDVVLGYDNMAGYQNASNPYFGATVGRVANRIAGARFKIGNQTYNLTANEPPNQLHGGFRGFDKQIWESQVVGGKVTFTYLSKDGEEGFPGDLLASTTYELTSNNLLYVTYQATSTKPTPVGLTSHSYFNLAGHQRADNKLQGHFVRINANSYTPVDNFSIPTGEIRSVKGTTYDLRADVNVNERLVQLASQNSSGYDINFCVNQVLFHKLRPAARVHERQSGRIMEVYTDQPGVQFFTANNLPVLDPLIGKGGAKYFRHGALCLESQNYPNAVNQPNFPNAILRPGEIYRHRVVYKFSRAIFP